MIWANSLSTLMIPSDRLSVDWFHLVPTFFPRLTTAAAKQNVIYSLSTRIHFSVGFFSVEVRISFLTPAALPILQCNKFDGYKKNSQQKRKTQQLNTFSHSLGCCRRRRCVRLLCFLESIWIISFKFSFFAISFLTTPATASLPPFSLVAYGFWGFG